VFRGGDLGHTAPWRRAYRGCAHWRRGHDAQGVATCHRLPVDFDALRYYCNAMRRWSSNPQHAESPVLGGRSWVGDCGGFMGRRESVELDGVLYWRRLDDEERAHRVYFKRHPGDAAKHGAEMYYHRALWVREHGAIPSGAHVHHLDFDPLNNSVGNLSVISASDHSRLHTLRRLDDLETAERMRANLDRIRPLTKAWHASDEGRAWHVEHGKRVWAAVEFMQFKCEQCGAAFESKAQHGRVRFCSNKCKAARRRDSGVDDVPTPCAHCGIEFMRNKYSGPKFCRSECRKGAAAEARRLRAHGRGRA